jgi:hypothetical protein
VSGKGYVTKIETICWEDETNNQFICDFYVHAKANIFFNLHRNTRGVTISLAAENGSYIITAFPQPNTKPLAQRLLERFFIFKKYIEPNINVQEAINFGLRNPLVVKTYKLGAGGVYIKEDDD